MKTIGLIGGMSWESTIPYYRLINEVVRERLGGLHSARIILYSVDFHEIERLQETGEWETAGALLAGIAQTLESAGADFLVLCTNTLHKVAATIESAVRIPLLHIADPSAEAIKTAGFSTVGLLGTRFTMEEAFYRDHVKYGLELAMLSQAFSPPALEILSQHHEYVDGSGWPAGRSGPQLSTVSRIVALVNRYDRLCSPESPEKEALMPAEALARLFRTETARFDGKLLSLMIKLLGVYPPGTVVRLNDDALGLVVSPGRDSLRPTVLIYTPEVNKKEAPTVDLAKTPQLKIEEALRPSTLPPDVQAWMNPRQRLSYFYSSENVE